MSAILLLNGPNLGILGEREPDVYGTDTLADIAAAVGDELAERGWKVHSVQHESEGDLVRAVHEHRANTVGAIVNPGALMIAGWSLRDALAAYPRPWIEVHLSNVWARERFRHESVMAPLADGVVVGLGAFGYRLAARALMHLNPVQQPEGSQGTEGTQGAEGTTRSERSA
ncbi:type II 3-dehydroquinate dehydratase [Streptomyces sp. NPDC058583]|uniref:type II 3-dehydroquinate dehydratase n=1 Tax=unclassified Streptomyces TaxID=2593676 RepID=UPI00364D0F68